MASLHTYTESAPLDAIQPRVVVRPPVPVIRGAVADGVSGLTVYATDSEGEPIKVFLTAAMIRHLNIIMFGE